MLPESRPDLRGDRTLSQPSNGNATGKLLFPNSKRRNGDRFALAGRPELPSNRLHLQRNALKGQSSQENGVKSLKDSGRTQIEIGALRDRALDRLLIRPSLRCVSPVHASENVSKLEMKARTGFAQPLGLGSGVRTCHRVLRICKKRRKAIMATKRGALSKRGSEV